jgi:hypothetical protein
MVTIKKKLIIILKKFNNFKDKLIILEVLLKFIKILLKKIKSIRNFLEKLKI